MWVSLAGSSRGRGGRCARRIRSAPTRSRLGCTRGTPAQHVRAGDEPGPSVVPLVLQTTCCAPVVRTSIAPCPGPAPCPPPSGAATGQHQSPGWTPAAMKARQRGRRPPAQMRARSSCNDGPPGRVVVSTHAQRRERRAKEGRRKHSPPGRRARAAQSWRPALLVALEGPAGKAVRAEAPGGDFRSAQLWWCAEPATPSSNCSSRCSCCSTPRRPHSPAGGTDGTRKSLENADSDWCVAQLLRGCALGCCFLHGAHGARQATVVVAGAPAGESKGRQQQQDSQHSNL